MGVGVRRRLLNWYARLAKPGGAPRPPYSHVAQLGEPVLRRASAAVPAEQLRSAETAACVAALRASLDHYGCVGLSAPQLGLGLRIFAMQYTRRHMQGLPNDHLLARGISLVPFTVFINPILKVLDYQKVTCTEGCESIKGFMADVPRYLAVEVSGSDENAEPITRQFEGWPARIAQHEMDHLNGIVYTDIMDKNTLHCALWEEVNMARGKLVIPFKPD